MVLGNSDIFWVILRQIRGIVFGFVLKSRFNPKSHFQCRSRFLGLIFSPLSTSYYSLTGHACSESDHDIPEFYPPCGIHSPDISLTISLSFATCLICIATKMHPTSLQAPAVWTLQWSVPCGSFNCREFWQWTTEALLLVCPGGVPNPGHCGMASDNLQTDTVLTKIHGGILNL